MSFTESTLTANEVLWASQGKPLLVGSNGFRNIPNPPIWSNATNPKYTDTDLTAPNYPTSALGDGYGDVLTKASGTIGRMFSIVALLNPYATLWSNNYDLVIDTVAIIGHNFGYCSSGSNMAAGAFGVQVDIAPVNDFSSGVKTLVSYQGSQYSNRRLCFSQLNVFLSAAHRYTIGNDGVMYIRVMIGNASLSLDATALLDYPSVGEIIVGARRQMQRQPFNTGYDNYALSGDFARVKSKAGSTTKYVRNEGQRLSKASFMPDAAGDISSFQQWYQDTGYGQYPYLWLEDPSQSTTTNTKALFCVTPDEMLMPFTGPYDRTVDIRIEEQAPFLSNESPFG